jgi:nucleotide-binding universal stress UspA family protein
MSDTHSTSVERILIAYDGSPPARHAIVTAARLFPGAHAHVVYAWQPLTGERTTAVIAATWGAADELLETEARDAQSVAAEGRETARSAGLLAVGEDARGAESIAQYLLRALDATRPELVVMGTRALHGLHGAVVGSTSHSLISHSPVPVLIATVAHPD